ncbi:unnamed protein product [Rotaria sp. Silwood1]|nr:unnamed protein product [Rotaria sp. Silwood1]
MATSDTTPSWEDLIKSKEHNKLKSCTCKIYNHQTQVSQNNSNQLCSCGRLIHRHSFSDQNPQQETGKYNLSKNPTQFRSEDSTTVPITIYGRLKPNGCKFIRLDIKTPMQYIYNLLVGDSGSTEHKPDLILSLYGDSKSFTMIQKLPREIICSIVDAAMTADGWILTDGVNCGVSKLVGESLSHYHLLREYSKKAKCIGLTMWGTVNESTRFKLKYDSKNYKRGLLHRQVPDNVEEGLETIEKNHTHCILFDDGTLNAYRDDSSRHKLIITACQNKNHTCYAVTIMFGGDIDTIEKLRYDIEAERPIVLIEESGCLADLLVSLIKRTADSNEHQQTIPTHEEIKQQVKSTFPNLDQSTNLDMSNNINKILDKKNRHLLNVFSLNRDKNIAQTIFKAIVKVKNKQYETNTVNHRKDDEQNRNKQYQKDLKKLIDLAVEWNCIDGALLILQSRQNFMKKTDHVISMNRPAFVAYFLAIDFDIRTLMKTQYKGSIQKNLLELYKDTHAKMNKSHAQHIETLFGSPFMKNIGELDEKLNKFVGSFIRSIYSPNGDGCTDRISIDMKNHSRICASLFASAIFKKYAEASTNPEYKEKLRTQALEFETYAAKFINRCYQYNERLACELLLREIPLFGHVTCMQVAISSKSQKLVATSCFDQTLNQVWFNKLSIANHGIFEQSRQVLAILSVGLLAPLIISYREEDFEIKGDRLSSHGINYYMVKKSPKNCFARFGTRFIDFHNSPMIEMWYHLISYIWFLLVFSYMMLYHCDSPATFTVPHWTEIYVIITISSMFIEECRKLCYEYKTRMVERWGSTESILLTLLTIIFYFAPYFLFYLGLCFRFGTYDKDIQTTARIILAFDLELWYIKSLKFMMGIKSFGPKLFMLKNMLRDLSGFVYMIFIAIAAYGVVSRAMIFYKQIPFTFNDIVKEIFYEPYWFIYGTIADKDLLDEKIKNDTASIVAEATATHILLAFHMLFINILILNLLIAVFTHTIDAVKENTQFYWRYQRYAFVREYFERLLFAYPPLNILTYIVILFIILQQKCYRKLCNSQVEVESHKSKSKGILRVFSKFDNFFSFLVKLMYKIDLEMISANEYEGTDRWDAFENAATLIDARSILEETKKIDVLTTDTIHSTKTTDTTEHDPIFFLFLTLMIVFV